MYAGYEAGNGDAVRRYVEHVGSASSSTTSRYTANYSAYDNFQSTVDAL